MFLSCEGVAVVISYSHDRSTPTVAAHGEHSAQAFATACCAGVYFFFPLAAAPFFACKPAHMRTQTAQNGKQQKAASDDALATLNAPFSRA